MNNTTFDFEDGKGPVPDQTKKKMSNGKPKRRIISCIPIKMTKVTVAFESRSDKRMFDQWVAEYYPDIIKRRLTTREVLEILAEKLELLGG